jgi:hypothetical protein
MVGARGPVRHANHAENARFPKLLKVSWSPRGEKNKGALFLTYAQSSVFAIIERREDSHHGNDSLFCSVNRVVDDGLRADGPHV